MQERKIEWDFAELEVSYTPPPSIIQISSSLDAYEIFKQVWDPQLLNIQEQFYVLLLSKISHVLSWRNISTGDGTSCIIDMQLLLSIICKSMAKHIIIAHNHPSGNPIPSKEDIYTTETMRTLFKMVKVKVLDHLIITRHGYTSLVDDDYISKP